MHWLEGNIRSQGIEGLGDPKFRDTCGCSLCQVLVLFEKRGVELGADAERND